MKEIYNNDIQNKYTGPLSTLSRIDWFEWLPAGKGPRL